MQALRQPGHDAFLGQDELPGVDLDEIARPQRHHHRAQNDLEVGLLQELRIGGERELVDDEPRIVVERIEALQQKSEQRADVDNADPQKRRQQKKQREKLGARKEDIGDPVEDSAFLFGCRHVTHAPSSMVTMADLGQMSRTLSSCLKGAAPARTSSVMRMSWASTLNRVTAP